MRPHSITFNPEESMTKQSFKDECDINKIMAKFQKTGVIKHYAAHAPTYGDASPVDYLDALQVIATANEMFAELPSSVRKRFSNNPEEFLEFVQNPENLDECRKMGLAPPGEPSPEPKTTKRSKASSEPSQAPNSTEDPE